ncbi:MAG TPA: DUF4142 domain-containing protein [Verrucomicrobiae bacterium]|nr:DUF4142 domain-containing protein [Verrucomicrobiae bacterium]
MKTKLTVMLTAGLSVMAMAALADAGMSRQNQYPNQTQSHSSLTAQKFAQEANKGNREEVSLAQLALQKSSNPAVKHFAHQMIRDHSQAETKLVAIANEEGYNLPDTNYFAEAGWPYTNNTGLANYKGAPPSGAEALTMMPMSETNGQPKDVAELENLSGSDFDRAYANEMVHDHQQDVQKFQVASQSLSDQKLKTYAQQCLPTLREHLRMAENMQNQVNSQ